jgi:hypothetical protein
MGFGVWLVSGGEEESSSRGGCGGQVLGVVMKIVREREREREGREANSWRSCWVMVFLMTTH